MADLKFHWLTLRRYFATSFVRFLPRARLVFARAHEFGSFFVLPPLPPVFLPPCRSAFVFAPRRERASPGV